MKGKIYKGIGGFYYVATDTGEIIECKARGKFRKERIIPIIGDDVEIEVKNGKGSITEIYERKNSLIRPAVANIDLIVVVVAAKDPDPATFVTDKMLVNAEINGIEAVVCINKTDLAENAELKEIYEKSGYKTLSVSATEKNGLDELFEIIKGKTAAFAGVSGVGKSTILSHITGMSLETGEVSDKISRGRHTTRHSELFKMDEKTYIADTPGFSSLEINFKVDNLGSNFIEFNNYSCRFGTCSHTKENECGIRKAVEKGEIAKSRYESYLMIYDKIKDIKDWNKKGQ